MKGRSIHLSLTILCVFMTAGCTYGRFGTLAAKRTVTATAEVIDVYGFGAQLRPGGVDGGFTFGWRHATYIYPFSSSGEASHAVRWTFGWAPKLSPEPFFLAARSIGAQFTKYPTVIQANIGARTDCFTFAADAEESRVVNFTYRSDAPAKTVLAMESFPTLDF